MSETKIPRGYKSELNLRETQVAIKKVKNVFEEMLTKRLNLTRVSAPLFLDADSGLNDTVNDTEKPVTFEITNMGKKNFEVVQSLAKWKRIACKEYDFKEGEGIYTDMNAIRRCDQMDNTHSIYVDQWDWEKVISKEDRNIDFFKENVKIVYNILRKTEQYMSIEYDYIDCILPKEIFFVTHEELAEMFPDYTREEREYYITKAKGAVCILRSFEDTAERLSIAPDYNDWNMMGKLYVYYPVLDQALKLASMGIRVDGTALKAQLQAAGCEERAKLPFQKSVIKGELPYTIGGGIGQSRICMFFLRKAHICEVQSSVWPQDAIREMKEAGISLL